MKIIILALMLFASSAHASEIVKQNMTTNESGQLIVQDYTDRINVLQEMAVRPIDTSSRADAVAVSKTKPINVSRGQFVTLRGVTQEQIDKSKMAQITILELKKMNLLMEKVDLRQQYEWNDHQLNDQIWHMDLLMAEIDPKYIPMRGEWSFGKHTWRELVLKAKRLWLDLWVNA